jgi:predicted nucleic acid-binding protein
MCHSQEFVEVIPFEPAMVKEALRLYSLYKDKAWGITDCFPFAIMRERGLTGALTADHDFEQAGFSALLLREPVFNS